MGGVYPFSLLIEERGADRIVERPEHAGHVPQRGAFNPPLTERASRFSLEVDDDEILPCIEHLPEMIVAVAANAHGRNFPPEDRLEALEDVLFTVQNPLGLAAHCLRQPLEALTQERKRLRRQAAHSLVDRALVEGREGFGREVGIDRIRGERDMQLGRALAQQLRRWQVRANGFLHERRKRFFAYSEQGVLWKGRLPHFVHEGPLEIVVEGLQGVLPGIPLVRHEAVENSDGHWLAVVLPVLQSASYSRGMGE